MGNHRAPAPTRPPHLWLALMGAACAGILLPPVVIAAQAVAPHPVAERLSLTPERATEPMGHGGLGGALSVPTVGVVAEGTSEALPPIVRQSFVRDETPSRAQPSTAHATAPASSPTASTGQGIATPDEGVTGSAQDSTTPVGDVGASETPAAVASPTASPTIARPTWTRSACQWRCRTGTPPTTQTTTEATTTTEETTSTEVTTEETVP